MAIDVQVPVSLPLASDDYISTYGTATLYLEYGTATTPADGTATATVVSGTEYYAFDVSGVTSAHYYRWRVGDGSTYTDYSSTFQLPLTYATLEEVLRGMDLPDTSKYDELERLLIDATDFVTTYICGGRSFFRDPVGSGTKTLSLDVLHGRQPSLSLARGRDLDIISLTSVGIAAYTGQSYDTIAADSTGYYLLPDSPATGQPYSDIVLSDQATLYTRFPLGYRVVQLVGAFGWSKVPDLVRRATVDLTRSWWHRQPGEADPVGLTAFGTPIFGPGTPKSVRDLHNSRYAWRNFV